MATTYTQIASQTLNSTTSSVNFSNISGSYTDLVLVVAGTLTTGTDNIALQFNGDTGNNYSVVSMLGDGSAASAFRSSNIANAGRCAMGTSSSSAIYSVNGYSNSTMYKTVLGRGGMSSYGVDERVSTWRNTAAITSILVFPTTYSFASGTVVSLYGITAQPTPTAKATGGTITYTSGYTVHTFTSTGTFTPSQNLQVEYLVVAGGGSGSYNQGNGGGAGGFRTNVGGGLLACSSGVGYTVTVGAGGATNSDGSNSSFNGINASGGGGLNGSPYGSGGPGGSGAGTWGGYPSLKGGAGNIGGYFPVEGYAGGDGGGDNAGAGGGGAGGKGGNAGETPTGGPGRSSLISGTLTYYAGGGGAGNNNAGYAGGIGGGGTGRVSTGNKDADVNSGGGAGGTRSGAAGQGGSGIVIVRYRN